MQHPHHPHRPHHTPKILLEGELFVTGNGEIVVEEALRMSRALLAHNQEAVSVEFVGDPECPPCAPFVPDELQWELFESERHHHGHHHHDHHDNDGIKEIYLKITWNVSCSRTIAWRIYEID